MADLVSYPDAIKALREWLAALQAAATGQSYSIAGRTLTRQDIGEIRAEIQRWHNTVAALEAKSADKPRTLGAVANFPAPGTQGAAGGLYPQSFWERYP